MSIITQILADFYEITKLPIQFLDEHLASVAALGLITTVPTFTADELKSNRAKIFTFVETDNGLHQFIVLPFNETAHQNGFFLIEIMEKSDHLIPHFEELIIAIVKRNITATTMNNPHIAKGLTFIHEHFAEPINLLMLCEHLGLNTCYFCVLFKNQTGMTFSKYLNKLRINESKNLLTTTTDSIIDISLSVGFNNHNHFSATFKKLTGVTPSVYRENAKRLITN